MKKIAFLKMVSGQGSDLSGRVTDLIDVVRDQQQNYVPEVIVIIINFFV